MHVWTCLSCLHVNIRNVTHARISPYCSLSWHGLWLRLIEDTTPARGALASALATRMAAPTARDPPQPLPPQTAQNTLKDLEVKKIQLHTPPAKPKVDNAFDFDSARRILTDLIAATPDVTICPKYDFVQIVLQIKRATALSLCTNLHTN